MAFAIAGAMLVARLNKTEAKIRKGGVRKYPGVPE
jgi:hypothetical protein